MVFISLFDCVAKGGITHNDIEVLFAELQTLFCKFGIEAAFISFNIRMTIMMKQQINFANSGKYVMNFNAIYLVECKISLNSLELTSPCVVPI